MQRLVERGRRTREEATTGRPCLREKRWSF
jgi:hypothetical protein